MKRLYILVFFVTVICQTASLAAKTSPYLTDDGQYIVTYSTATSVRPLLNFKKDEAGIFKTTSKIDKIDESVVLASKDIIAFCPKESKILYFHGNGLYEAFVVKDFLKILKKDKSLVNVDAFEFDRIAANMKSRQRYQIEEDNREREAFLSDSIAEVKRLEALEIERQREAERINKLETYRKQHAHDWRHFPSDSKLHMKCEVCEDEFLIDDATIAKISEKHWLFTNTADTVFNFVHISNIPDANKQPASLKYHLEAFADSIMAVTQPDTIADFDIDMLHIQHVSKADSVRIHYQRLLTQRYPNGYIKDWSWDEDYGNVSVMVRFNNTCKKTIKYITIYFRIYNDVDDVRCTGSVKGTGPVEPYEDGLWEWDSTKYWVSNDATSMRIYKVLLNYMDGTSKTLTGNSLTIFRE